MVAGRLASWLAKQAKLQWINPNNDLHWQTEREGCGSHLYVQNKLGLLKLEISSY